MKSVIFIGLQGSGKSSFYFSQLANTHLRLNMDMLKTRHREKLLFEACLASKTPTVIDNTNPTRDGRAGYIDAFKAHKFQVTGYFFQSRLADCMGA